MAIVQQWDFLLHVKSAIMTEYDTKQRPIVIVESIRAISLELRAFDGYLATHPEERVSVVKVGIVLRPKPDDYHRTQRLHS